MLRGHAYCLTNNCIVPPLSRPLEAVSLYIKCKNLWEWRTLASDVSAQCAAGLSGCAPCRLRCHGHSASIPHAFAPAALRASLASRGSAQGPSPPRVAWRPSNTAEPDTPDRPGQRSAAMGGALANTLALAAAGSADACRPRRWRFSSIASRRMVSRTHRSTSL